MKKGLIFQKRQRRSQRIGSAADPDRSRYVVMVVGGALAAVGWVDALLLWYPLNFGNPEWEFATTSGFFDALPLGTLGLAAVTAAAMAQGARRLLLPLAILFPLIGLMLIASGVLFALSAVAAWKAIGPEFATVLERAVLKTSLLSAVYVALYLWLGWTVRRAGSPH